MSKDQITCLIVSGDAGMRASLRQMLAGYGYAPHEAGTGKQALVIGKQLQPGLLVMDCELPDMDCAGLLMALGRLFAQSMPAVLACSLRGNLQQISAAMQGGANECIVKPFDTDVLDFKLRLIGAVKGQSC